jgi:hypothetical protein
MFPLALMFKFGVPKWLGYTLVVIMLVLWIWTLVDCLRNEKGPAPRLIWFAVILLPCGFGAGPLGALAYFLIRSLPRRKSQSGH